MTTKAWLKKHTSSLTGKRIALFGSTGGLGQALARHILALGGALIMIDRNQEKAATAEARLRAEFPDAQICCLSADLSDMDTVRALCDELMTAPPDAIIHNAGAYHIPRKICKTGYDNVFEINFAAPYYVTRTLLPLLRAKGSRIVAVGTTTCRTLESFAAAGDGVVLAGSRWTNIFIYPGYEFRCIDALVTNFHLPGSTLVMLVSALAGRENILNAYQTAVEMRYRFFSFGDAMFIGDLPADDGSTDA